MPSEPVEMPQAKLVEQKQHAESDQHNRSHGTRLAASLLGVECTG